MGTTTRTMTPKRAQEVLLMPGPEPCCDRPMTFRGFRTDRKTGLVTAAEFRCRDHLTLWTPEDAEEA